MMDETEVKAKSRVVLTQKDLTFVLSTVDAEGRPRSRIMGGLVPVPETDFDFHMITYGQARKVQQLAGNPHAQILAYQPDWSEIVNLTGTASLVEDESAKDASWEAMPEAHRYFQGREDPNFAVLHFKGEQLEYLAMQVQRQPFIVRL